MSDGSTELARSSTAVRKADERMTTQDEAFKEWWAEYLAHIDFWTGRKPIVARAAWDASGKHAAKELARKDELLAAYRIVRDAGEYGWSKVPGAVAACLKIAKLEAE